MSRRDIHSGIEPYKGTALLVVLAFIVLLTGLVLAYFSRSGIERQLAKSSFDDSAADVLATSALQIVVSDFKQEIANNATVTSANVQPTSYGLPAAGQTTIPNLVRRSVSGDPTGRTSNISSSVASANGRSISLARWNSHYLIPRASTSTSIDSTPVSSFNAPDWVLVTRGGPVTQSGVGSGASAVNNSSPTNPNFVMGRYAYAVYDEGGLVDVNVAGFPFQPASPASAATPGVPSSDVGRKGTVALSDLTGLPTSPTVITSSTSTPGSWNSASSVNDLVGWRNYATVQPGGSFGSFSFDSASGSSGTGSRFLSIFLSQTLTSLTVSQTVTGDRTDQAFINRGELLAFRNSSGFSQSILQYLGTFSRERNKPTWSDSGTRLIGRFPLGRFNGFASTPPSNTGDIQKYFGLAYVPASPGPPVHAEHWQYVGTSGGALQSSIPSISGSNQDPDLFRLLHYALPSASVGEILSIGASLIDQVDSNDETTWIEFGDAATPQKAFGVDRNPSTEPDAPSRPNNVVVLNRPLRNVGELGYAYRNASSNLDFLTGSSADAPLLDLFTFNTATTRAGTVNLNTGNIAVVTALLTGATTNELSPAIATRTNSYHTAQNVVTESNRQHAIGRADVARLAGAAGSFFGSSDEARKTTVRALAELCQTRTWNLMIDVVAQSGRYPPNASTLADFVVQGEKRYWLHFAIDRVTGEPIDQQLEEVFE
jgi:Tfp pilus assembly protein PilX